MHTSVIREQVIHSLREGAELRLRLIECCTDQAVRAAQAIHRCFRQGGKVMLFGNGGSAADAQHIAAEFVGRFMRERAPLPALALTTDTSALTAVGNDYGFEQVFARQIRALGRRGDVAIAISTSGRSPNIIAGVQAARDQGLITIGLTGGDGGALRGLVEIPIGIPSTNTARIQECHLALEHILCEIVEGLWLVEQETVSREDATSSQVRELAPPQ